MASREPFPAGASPLAPLGELAHRLLEAGLHLGAGLAIGLLGAQLMRNRHLHWSWSLTALALAPLAGWLSVGGAPTLLCAAACAALRGRRWQREDLDTGGDVAHIARARQTPLGLVLRLVRRWRLVRPRPARTASSGELALGLDQSNRIVSVPFGCPGAGSHTLVLGATGSGKTMTQTWIATAAIERGMGAVVIDPKGDPRLRQSLEGAAGASERAFIEWSPEGPSVYNPLARGTDTQIADKALAGERFSEPHYLRQAQRYLGHAARVMRCAGVETSLVALVEHLEPAALEGLARSLPEPQARAAHAYLDSLTPRQRADLTGVRDRLAILVESDAGRWLDPQTPAAPRFDLLGAVEARAVVYFDLDADSRPLLAQMLGAAIVQDLQATVAALQGRPLPTLVVLDEFSAVAAERVAGLFGRARGAGFSLLLGTQELADLRLQGREVMREQLLGNLTTLIAHRQVVPESASLVARLAGSRGAWQTSRHSGGTTVRRRTAEPLLEPDRVMGLAPGSAAVIVLTRGPSARIARIFPVSPR
jgi:hypothetical protein